MPKCSLKNRILQLRVITCIFSAAALVAVVQFISSHGTNKYAHIPEERVADELYRNTNPLLVKSGAECSYDVVLKSTDSLNSWDIPRQFDDFAPTGLANGSFAPPCRPAFSVAILVTYRNRQEQLNIFLPYMHNFLRKQNIHYKIYLIEQRDEKPWNKGMLYNIGARRAIADQFPCLILHDVDLLPLVRNHLYACTARPRHMSASIDKFRYVLPYESLVGGVLAIRADQYVAVNGFSNRFQGWGGEDDDLAERLARHELPVTRFPVRMSRYCMLRHAPARPNAVRRRILAENRRRATAGDGYRSVPYSHLEVQQHRLFTMIGVKL